ncbi:amino acid adenylation domain-containing protein [Rhodococcus sp. IEGM1300]
MQDVRPNPTLRLNYCAERPIFIDFVQQSRHSPEAIAVVAQEASCSYRQLEQISQGIASFLIANGATGSERVVIVSSRCAALVYAMLGVSRAGLVFSVADIAYPPARIGQIIHTLQPTFVLLCGEAADGLNLQTLEPLAAQSGARVVRIPQTPDAALLEFPASGALPEVDPGNAAYITFTSGSTGEPKGIVTTHAPLVHFIEWHTRQHSLTRDDCFSMLSGLGHDPVYRDVFTPLSIGAKIVIPDQSTVVNPSALAAWIYGNGVSVIHLTPPLGKLIETGARISELKFNALRYLFWGGEALGVTLFEQISRVAPNAQSVNFYGTTETPQAMAYHPVDPAADNTRIALGKGIDGAQLLLVNEANQLVGEGEVGEILIRSPYLSQGYFGDSAQTREKFVVNPFTNAPDDLCYRTGDLGTYLSDGSVSFLGRGDSQVKIRGHRIELGEIEGVLSRHPHLKQCVVLADDNSATVRLVAYCVCAEPVSSAQLREHVAQQLPDYMVPALFVFLDVIPLTPNGKVDKRALSSALGSADLPTSTQDLSPLAAQLANAWAEILEVRSVDANLTFVELGGDSLSFVQASMVLEGLIGHLPDQWEMIPVRELCELRSKAPGSRFSIRAVEIPVLLRVLAIVLIVAGHFHLFSKWPIAGETKLLFLISGISLARFQLKAINERGNAGSLIKSMVSIAVPTILYTVLTQVMFDRVHWQTLLLISNWFRTEDIGVFTYWYIELLVQMIAIIGLALSFQRVRQAILADPFRFFIITACGLAVASVLINAYVFDASDLQNRVPQHYLSVMVLGMAIYYAHSNVQKCVVSAVALLLMGWQDALAVYGNEALLREYVDIALPAVLMLIWVRSVPVPGLIARGVALIASSTLYIYLTHFQFQSLARRIVDVPALSVVIAVVGGIAVGYVWNKVVRFVLTHFNGGKKKSSEESIERVA